MSMYREKFGLADFRVEYEWLTETSQQPFQHMRCDFAYAGDDICDTSIFMIWPEFETRSGNAIMPGQPIPTRGCAAMWIINRNAYASYHKDRLRIGTCAFFMMGSQRLATLRVTRLIGLE